MLAACETQPRNEGAASTPPNAIRWPPSMHSGPQWRPWPLGLDRLTARVPDPM